MKEGSVMSEKELKLVRECILSEIPPYPNNMLVELTNICNHRCIFCAHKKMKRSQGFCNKELMWDIINQAYELGTREIGFYLGGETFLSKDLEWFVHKCREKGFEYIYVTTNGVLADKDRVKRLCELGLSSIKFSMDAATPETYKKIHGKDDFLLAKKNLFDVLSLKAEGIDLGVFVSYAILKCNQSEVEMFKEDIGKYVDDMNIVYAMEQGGETPELIPELVDPNLRLGKLPCEMIFNRFHVTYEGYLCACCVDMENMLAYADLSKTLLKDAWYNETITKLRKEHLSGSVGNNRCYNCVNVERKETVEPLLMR